MAIRSDITSFAAMAADFESLGFRLTVDRRPKSTAFSIQYPEDQAPDTANPALEGAWSTWRGALATAEGRDGLAAWLTSTGRTLAMSHARAA